MPVTATTLPGTKRIVRAGDPGESWTNTSDKVQYQLIVDWHNSCAVCIGRDHMIGPLWPTPFHRGCRCKQKAIYPGKTSEPFVDFRQMVRDLPEAERSRVMGRSNLLLVEKGVVKWDDVVTSGRIRSLREVVSRNKLTVKAMTGAGVRADHASKAWDAVHTPAHEIAAQERTEALAALDDLVGKEEARARVARKLAERVHLASDPTYRPVMPGTAFMAEAVADHLLTLGVKREAIERLQETRRRAIEDGEPPPD